MPRKQHTRSEAFHLVVSLRFQQAQFFAVRHQRGHAVVTQTTGVEPGWCELAAQCVHFGQWRHARGVAKIVGIGATCQGRACGRFHGHDARFLTTTQGVSNEWERNACKVGATACTANDDVRPGICHLHLHDGFLANDRLMQQHVVEHRTQRVLGVVALHGQFDCFGNGDAQAARMVGRFGQHGAAIGGFH